MTEDTEKLRKPCSLLPPLNRNVAHSDMSTAHVGSVLRGGACLNPNLGDPELSKLYPRLIPISGRALVMV